MGNTTPAATAPHVGSLGGPGSGRLDSARPQATTSGVLLASLGLPFVAAHASFGPIAQNPMGVLAAAIASTLALLSAALLLPRRQRLGKRLTSIALLGSVGLGSLHLLASPFLTLSALLATTTALVLLWNVAGVRSDRGPLRRRPLHEGRAHGAAFAALVQWFLGLLAGVGPGSAGAIAILLALGTSALLTLVWALRERQHSARARFLLGATVLVASHVLVFWGNDRAVGAGLAVLAACATVTVHARSTERLHPTSLWDPLLGHPERLFVGTFAALCLVGTVILALPESSASGRSIGLLDALFTATSAVCVTGLVVLDTPVDFSVFGQVAILLLIQLGGLGIMTFSTATLWALGRRMSLRHESAVASLISAQDRGQLFATAKRIVVLTALSEGVGALVLTAAFVWHGDGVAQAMWRGLFTSISAFCNAGFALQSDSLIPYQSSPLVLHTVAALIILGGLSPVAVFALPALARRATRPVAAQAQLGVAAAGVLLLVGFICILAFEWNDSLRGMPLDDRVHNAWFQSVTLRTAGFNSIDITLVRPATWTLMMLWMFIGGSPGGTAGGIKTTTAAVLFLSVVHAIRGRWTLEAFGRRISERTRARALVVTTVAFGGGLVALVCIQLTQDMAIDLAAFEVVSALGTVGLSLGGTALLDEIGKLIIVACMFVGRVGGLTLLMLLRTRQEPSAVSRPEEEVDVG